MLPSGFEELLRRVYGIKYFFGPASHRSKTGLASFKHCRGLGRCGQIVGCPGKEPMDIVRTRWDVEIVLAKTLASHCANPSNTGKRIGEDVAGIDQPVEFILRDGGGLFGVNNLPIPIE